MNVRRRLSKRERDKLEALMEIRDPSGSGYLKGSVTFLHGFLTSIVSGPVIAPSEWLPIFFSHANDEAIALVMRFSNEICSDLETERFGIMVDCVGDKPKTVDYADNWCRGYLRGIAMRPAEWSEATKDQALHTYMLPILGLGHPEVEPTFDPVRDPEVYDELLNALPQCALKIYKWWRERLLDAPAVPSQSPLRRTTPRVSPNAACPCGSGKKYKRCCSPLRTV